MENVFCTGKTEWKMNPMSQIFNFFSRRKITFNLFPPAFFHGKSTFCVKKWCKYRLQESRLGVLQISLPKNLKNLGSFTLSYYLHRCMYVCTF
jgi:hypothetical protein